MEQKLCHQSDVALELFANRVRGIQVDEFPTINISYRQDARTTTQHSSLIDSLEIAGNVEVVEFNFAQVIVVEVDCICWWTFQEINLASLDCSGIDITVNDFQVNEKHEAVDKSHQHLHVMSFFVEPCSNVATCFIDHSDCLQIAQVWLCVIE